MIPDAELLDALRRWARSADSFRLSDYDEWARANDAASPSTLILRFGSWSEAMRSAGLSDRLTTSRQQRQVISDAEIWACVVAYLRADRDRRSYADLGVWLRESGLPSAATVRARLGRWSEVRDTAQRVLDYEGGLGTGAEPWPFADEVLSITPGAGPRRELTEDACAAALHRTAVVLDGPLTMAAYDAVRAPEEPSSSALLRRFGGWRDALKATGLGDRTR
ncbi:homing endonuclease associated repeat-containing protein [Gulosibacter sp. 10]|uniref:homing endonuclease associated repeat-containing protein n=1 Tax=Gulosibacter sp. 10 TaxID=1255570 RepID=UPI00097F066F|nr:hypothetical protein [Gulosibacter sp. 10]SJM67959.1 hypothetical protein FM112_13020 [Gulosibacter sp. 10]